MTTRLLPRVVPWICWFAVCCNGLLPAPRAVRTEEPSQGTGGKSAVDLERKALLAQRGVASRSGEY